MLSRLAPLVLVVPLLAACGGAKSTAADSVDLRSASARTLAGGSARFTLSVDATVAGVSVGTSERGAVSFTRRRGHFYKLVPGGGLPQESILDGPFTYTNANVQAALSDPSVKPWTKLDNRRLPPAQRLNRIDDLDHVRALAYLADGVADAQTLSSAAGRTHVRGRVDPDRLLARAPRSQRRALHEVIRSDYVERPFPAEFWLDAQNRVLRVRVAYRTPKGSRILIDGAFSDFGAAVDVTLPPARSIQDISP